MQDLAIYIHIPFCKQKCIYCDFYSIVTEDRFEAYSNALISEIEFYARKYANLYNVTSIFIGGGTPSLLPLKYFEKIVKTVYDKFRLNTNLEFTVEVNPGTVDSEKIKFYKEIGVNRVSVGVQSFDEKDLRFLSRIHDKKKAIDTIFGIYKEGIENINIDLIFSIPKQSSSTWISNLYTAIELPVKHISAYSLILEHGTSLYKKVKDGSVKMQPENSDASVYKKTMDFMRENDFVHYEVSNYAKKGYECKHNISYWNYTDYLGFGTAAHSFIKPERFWNCRNISKYIEDINKKNNAVLGSEILTETEQVEEMIMLGLRSSGIGVKGSRFEEHLEDWYKKSEQMIHKFVKEKLMHIRNGKIMLTNKGLLIADEIIRELLINV